MIKPEFNADTFAVYVIEGYVNSIRNMDDLESFDSVWSELDDTHDAILNIFDLDDLDDDAFEARIDEITNDERFNALIESALENRKTLIDMWIDKGLI